MIATIFLIVMVLAGAVAVCSGLGLGPALLGGHGTHRLIPLGVRQLRQELSAARHELDGAEHYVRQLESDQTALSRDLENVRGERDGLQAIVDTAALRIAELEEQLVAAGRTRQENTALRAALANARPIGQAPGTPPEDITVLPEDYEGFVNETANEWRATSAQDSR
ncbi:hypothetical protein [Streptomyces sp. NPDC088182]|uniref:hypothetical protein n=1 Tax=Streptomyces sp. NPDC088182 TaxID=3365838 RepID=UPI00381EA0C3